MKLCIVSVLLLIFTVESDCSAKDRFFISAPSVFHVGVREKVFIQLGQDHLNKRVTLYLEHEVTGTIMSEKETAMCTDERQGQTVELTINAEMMSTISFKNGPRYLLLVAEINSVRKLTRVLVSNHRGYIFIQTNQPMYNPNQRVQYRIFTLNHTMRPHAEMFHLSIINAAGNTIMKSLKTAKDGIFRHVFDIPDVSKMGTWKIKAHYAGDEANAVSREFKVQKFVLPSFEVSINMEHRYILLSAEKFVFTISAIYSRGDKVKGAYHCQFGVANRERTKTDMIRGLELTGSIESGSATPAISIAKISEKLANQTLSDLQQSGAQLYLGVFVTNIQSGEMQKAEVYLPIISRKYTMDLSRTRSYFVPGYPLDVVVVMRLPDGSPAPGVEVDIRVEVSAEKSWKGITDEDGAVATVFNINTQNSLTVKATAGGTERSKEIKMMSSPSGSYLYLSLTNRVYSVNSLFAVTFNTQNSPTSGYIYYMVLSRGILLKHGSLPLGRTAKSSWMITHDMVPSFRLIAYFYSEQGDVIADSAWIDVRDECQIKVEVQPKGPFVPGKASMLDLDLKGETAKVALLAVDKAFYGLQADNKLTRKQVFSTMQSYDIGCSYGGGADPTSVLLDAGLSFTAQGTSHVPKFECGSARQRRSVDLQQEILAFKSRFADEALQECCVHGFSLIPMSLSCEQRAQRVSVVNKNPACTDAFLKCCLEGDRLRKKKLRDDALEGFGRTASKADIEEFFMDTSLRQQYVRRHFPESFSFTEINVKGQTRHPLYLPDSITTWEIQVVALSPNSGFCVVAPVEVKATKEVFVSLTLPISVRKFEQIGLSPVIYNYGDTPLHLAVHMEQTKGLCTPGSATTSAFVNITVNASSSQFVTFSAVPMETGLVPIKIRLYDIEDEMGLDAIEKNLNVKTEGLEMREEETKVIKLQGRSTSNFTYDGTLPDGTVPDSSSSVFISMEGNGFGNSQANYLLSPEAVARLIILPTGCLEQTMVKLAPTTFALRYLDLSEQWFNLPAGKRDDALDKIEHGFMRILDHKMNDNSYGLYRRTSPNNWVTALVVKVLSMVAERQVGAQGRTTNVVPENEIRKPVNYLLSVQRNDGTYTDTEMVLHRNVLKDRDQTASLTAFITIALHRSLQFLQREERAKVEAGISRSASYLLSQYNDLQHPYAVAITAYCLSFCVPEHNGEALWGKLQAMATKVSEAYDCYLWSTDANAMNKKRADAITVETTAYALLTAIVLKKTKFATGAACWLSTQEGYSGGYIATQDTIMALQALSEYELFRSNSPETNVVAEFTVPGKKDTVSLELKHKREKVETDMKKLTGNTINVQLTGTGEAKVKIVKAYYLLDSKDDCDKLSITVTVQGKVKYTDAIIAEYEYDDYGNSSAKDAPVSQSADDGPEAHTRNRREADPDLSSEDITYTVCVRHSPTYSLTGMAIADVTLLSGFEAEIEDLDRLKDSPEAYISHYEVTYGRVLLYFNRLFQPEECISFSARQRVPIGLLQPAPAVFYDYYEPSRKCTRFYSAPMRSKMVSKLCSEDVCQCAERPCHKQITNLRKKGKGLTKSDRTEHACFFPTVDYGYIVEVVSVSTKSNFDLYKTKVIDVLRSHGDGPVKKNSVRVFAKRRQCKEELVVGKQYLIMGKDGSTTDSDGEMQYLLESNTWVELMPSVDKCKRPAHQALCKEFTGFVTEYKLDGCRQ